MIVYDYYGERQVVFRNPLGKLTTIAFHVKLGWKCIGIIIHIYTYSYIYAYIIFYDY